MAGPLKSGNGRHISAPTAALASPKTTGRSWTKAVGRWREYATFDLASMQGDGLGTCSSIRRADLSAAGLA